MRTTAATVILAGLAALGACATASGAPVSPTDQPVALLGAPPEQAAKFAARPDCRKMAPEHEPLPGTTSYTYAATPSRTLRIHVVAPDDAAPTHPAIVFYFGGGWRTGQPEAFLDEARAMAKEGYVALLPDYRVGCRDGTLVTQAAEDATLSYNWIRGHAAELKIDPRRIVMSGGSAGGHIALTAALEASPGEKPAALVLFNPPVDLVPLARPLQISIEEAAALSPSVLPLDNAPPTVIFHGEDDQSIPISTTRAFCDRMVAAHRTCEFHGYAGQGHGFFHSHDIDTVTGTSPFDDTLVKTLAFLTRQGLTR